MENERKAKEKSSSSFSALRGVGLSVFEYESIDSTNNEAKRYAQAGGSAPALFVADGQTAGRGRMGRSFYSPADTGIYLSLLLAAPENEKYLLRMTSVAAVAAHDAIFNVLGIDTGIKWVNDLYLNGKKISGILAERFFAGNSSFVVIGVGINLSTSDFPAELRHKAGSLSGERNDDVKARLTEEVALSLIREMDSLDSPTIIERYRRCSLVIGRAITFVENGVVREGIAEEIDDLGALLVRLGDGSIYRLGSGEISLRLN